MTRLRRPTWCLVCTLAIALAPTPATAQRESKTYVDSQGKKVNFPQGDASFADEVVVFDLGLPAPPDRRWADPSRAIGPPDYNPRRVDPTRPADVVLGCAGTLIMRFADNTLVDVPGPDLYVFEVGPAVEGMRVAISLDGTAWTDVGTISGGTAQVDIGAVARPGEAYRYVRITDLKSACSGRYPGADVDAVGAIGSALQLSFDASVLFEFNSSTLLPRAQAALTEAASQVAAYAGAAVTVEGHTDSVGADAYNLKLSQARAESVRAFLVSRPELKGRAMAAIGRGAARPVASNDSDAGRQKNRRVEIVIVPAL